MTDEELRDLVAGHQALSPDERHIVGEVFDAGKRQIREVLVPRTEVEFLPASMPIEDAVALATEQARYSRFPVYQESYDDVIGFVHARDLIDSRSGQAGKRVGEVCRPVKFLPISKMVLSALSEMRKDRAHLAIVVDEYGGTAGIVTLEDLVEELIGDIQDEYDEDDSHPRQLHGGELEVDGLLNLDEFAEQTGLELPEGPYETVAGYLLAALGHLPADGESAEVSGRRLTVTQLDGRRIARLRVSPAPAETPAGTAPPGPRLADRRAARLRSMPPGEQTVPEVPAGLSAGPVLVVDFGAQYAQLIARRVREHHVYSMIVPSTMSTAEMLALGPSARSSCPAARPRSTPTARRPGRTGCSPPRLPVLGICYGFQLMVRDLGGEVRHTGTGEYGATALHLAEDAGRAARRAAEPPAGVDVARRHLRGPRRPASR